ncbi:antibiotic resistance protein VanZ [uncultured Sphaerochaeta sp.]|uniref:VanZ family protein n=1 Tax=uncultured Sphaerochaeta sp. TaxID=886478 RepID=UPI002A0A8EFE|nr:antibiotic resistance protein VanZ [uncultured Sphaerochaeta sp.]
MKKRLPLQLIIRTIGIVLTVLIVIMIIHYSFIPANEFPVISWIPFADKGDHMLAYAGLGFSLFLAILQIPGSGKTRKEHVTHSTLHLTSWSGRSVVISLLIGSALGALIELLQPLFGRSREWLDFFSDTLGLVVGVAVALMILKLVGSFFLTRPWLYDPNWKDEVHELD